MNTFLLISYDGGEAYWVKLAKQGDFVTALEACDASAGPYIRQWLADPHNDAASVKNGDDIRRWLMHPQNLLPKKAQAVLDYINDSDLYFNRRGGWCCPTPKTKILNRVESETWPADVHSGVKAVISRYPGCPHYYVSFGASTVTLSKDKFDTLEEARAEALKVVLPENLTINQTCGYPLHPGD